jgi:ABC-type multidrug transport system fused ATPase/permease subunit
MFLCHQGKSVLASVGNYLTTMAAENLARNLRLRLLRHLDTLSADYHESNPDGALLFALQEPIDEVSYFGSDLLPSVLRTFTACLLTFVTMVVLNARMALAVLPLVAVFLLAAKRFRGRMEESANRVQQENVAWMSFLAEHVASILALQLLRQERRRERRAFQLLGARIRSYNRLFKTGVVFSFYTSLTVGLSTAAVVGYGGWSVLTDSMTVGGLIAFYTYLAQLFEPLSGVAEIYVRAQKTFASIRQLQTILALRPTIVSSSTASRFPKNSWAIALSEVRFHYPEHSGLLSVARLHIGTGEHLAIAGQNGAGKSTLAKLLARLYDVDSGSISIEGQDLKTIDLDSLRDNVCYLGPQPVLFDTTIAGNLRLGKPTASQNDCEQAVKMVGLTACAGALQDGLDHRIGPGGFRLSGGERQRLGIARAVLRRPHILILDEATSALDASSEQRLLMELRRILPGTTILVISHRMPAILSFPRVILLEAGNIVGDSSPDSLFMKDDFFRIPDTGDKVRGLSKS